MRLLLVLIGIAAFAAVGWVFERGTRDTREWNELLEAARGEFRVATSEEEERRIGLLSRRVGDPSSRYRPWKALTVEGPGGSRRIVLLSAIVPKAIPWDCNLRIDVFDESRRLWSSTRVGAGHGTVAESAAAPSRENLLPATFEILTDSGRPGDEDRSVYALVGDRPALVRYDIAGGGVLRNSYSAPGQQIGPTQPFRSVEQAERALGSSDPAELLEVLLWLGAWHAVQREPRVYQESLEEVRRWQETLARPGVRARLSELTKHPHPWVGEAARKVK